MFVDLHAIDIYKAIFIMSFNLADTEIVDVKMITYRLKGFFTENYYFQDETEIFS